MAVSTEYPIEDTPIVRGDPLCIPVDFSIDGVPIDISEWVWRSQIRRSADGRLVTEFNIEVVTPEGGTVPNQLLLSLTPDQTRILRTGMVFDLEQLSNDSTPETLFTWWIVTKMKVVKDVSHA